MSHECTFCREQFEVVIDSDAEPGETVVSICQRCASTAANEISQASNDWQCAYCEISVSAADPRYPAIRGLWGSARASICSECARHVARLAAKGEPAVYNGGTPVVRFANRVLMDSIKALSDEVLLIRTDDPNNFDVLHAKDGVRSVMYRPPASLVHRIYARLTFMADLDETDHGSIRLKHDDKATDFHVDWDRSGEAPGTLTLRLEHDFSLDTPQPE